METKMSRISMNATKDLTKRLQGTVIFMQKNYFTLINSRFFDKYTKEIRDNFERGTAL